MKGKVIKKFRDKNTKKVYKAGNDYKADKPRLEELQSLGFVKLTKKPSLLDGNVNQIKELITGEMSKENLTELLNEEKNGEKRKGVIKHIESLLS